MQTLVTKSSDELLATYKKQKARAEKMKGTIDDQKEKIKRNESIISEQESKIEKLKDKVHSLGEKIAAKTDVIKDLEKREKKFDYDYESLKSDHEITKRNLEKERSEINKDLRTTRAKNEQTRVVYNFHKENAARFKAESEIWAQKIMESRESIRILNAQIETKRSKLNDLEAQLNSINAHAAVTSAATDK